MLQNSNKKLHVDERLRRTALSLTDTLFGVLEISQRRLNLVSFDKDDEMEAQRSFEDVPQSMIDKGMVHEDDIEECHLFFSRIYDGSLRCEACVRILNAKGEWLIYELCSVSVRSESGHLDRAVISARNATLAKRVEEIYKRYLEAIMQNTNYVWEFDLEHDVLIRERIQKEALLERGEEQTYTGIFSIACEQIPDGYRQRVEYLFRKDHLLDEFYRSRSEAHYDFPINIKDRIDPVWVQGSAYLTLSPAGNIHAIMCLRDVINRDTVKEVLDHASQSDILSGLLNGEVFRQKVNDVLKNDRRTKGGHLFIIAIDNFNEISTMYGSTYGDELIRSIADILKDCFRREDILGRVGEGEFTAFVKNIDEGLAKERASEVAGTLAQIQHEHVGEITTTLSIGIAEAGIYDGYASLHKKAYKALYRAQENGKGSWSLWG